MVWLSKGAVEDASDAAAAIVGAGLSWSSITPWASQVYQSQVKKPHLDVFDNNYGMSPSLLIKGLLDDYNSSKLGGRYQTMCLHFWKRTIKPFVWACIYKTPSITLPDTAPYELSPQLIILLGDLGISAGLSNGVSVDEHMPSIHYVRTIPALQTSILQTMQKSSDWRLQPHFFDPAASPAPGYGSYPPSPVASAQDVAKHWYDRPRVVKFIPRGRITHSIENDVINALDDVAPLFKQIPC